MTKWKDENARFGIVSVVLHWITAGFVITLLVIGFIVWPLPRGAHRSSLLYLHVSVAMLALPFVAARIAWRLRNGMPRTVVQPRTLELAAEITWRALLAAIVMQFITGPLIVWMHGRPIEILGVVGIPPPFAPKFWLAAHIVTPLHDIVAVILALLLTAHILGALKHLLYDRDRTVQQMIWPRMQSLAKAAGDQQSASELGKESRDVQRAS